MLEVRGRIFWRVAAVSLCSFLVGCNQGDGGRTVSESRLSSVLVQWENEGGDLADMLQGLGDYPIKDRADAQAICRALACSRADQADSQAVVLSPLFTLAALFQDVAGEDAFIELDKNGLPHLRRFVRQQMGRTSTETSNEILFLLKILAMYRCPEDIDLITAAARLPVEPESYMWSLIFGQMDDKHPAWRRLCDDLRHPLPEGFLGVAYLDLVNGHALHGSLDNHPFATPEGTAAAGRKILSQHNKGFK